MLGIVKSEFETHTVNLKNSKSQDMVMKGESEIEFETHTSIRTILDKF